MPVMDRLLLILLIHYFEFDLKPKSILKHLSKVQFHMLISLDFSRRLLGKHREDRPKYFARHFLPSQLQQGTFGGLRMVRTLPSVRTDMRLTPGTTYNTNDKILIIINEVFIYLFFSNFLWFQIPYE